MTMFEHVPHPHVAARKQQGPVTVRGQLPLKHRNPVVRFNARLAVICTAVVGSMWCAYAFAGLAFAGLPTALKPGNIGFMFWLASDFFQLVLLSVIIVGQNIQATASDKRAEQTYLDAEAVLHEAQEIQAHLQAQDDVLTRLAAPGSLGAVGKLSEDVASLADAVRASAALSPQAGEFAPPAAEQARDANAAAEIRAAQSPPVPRKLQRPKGERM